MTTLQGQGLWFSITDVHLIRKINESVIKKFHLVNFYIVSQNSSTFQRHDQSKLWMTVMVREIFKPVKTKS